MQRSLWALVAFSFLAVRSFAAITGIVMTVDGPSAHAKVAEMTRRGDVILFENDLPDVYA